MALGALAAFQFLPVLVFGAWGGVIADRFPKRKILYFTQSVSALLAVILAALVAANVIRVWMVYLLALGLGMANAIDNPARQTFIFEMVGKDYVKNAVSLNGILRTLRGSSARPSEASLSPPWDCRLVFS